MTRLLLVGGLVLGVVTAAGANHPQACYLDLGATPDRRASRKCQRWQVRLCRLCQKYPGMTLCLNGDVCDTSHGCFSYTPSAAECAAGRPLPAGCPTTTTTSTTTTTTTSASTSTTTTTTPPCFAVPTVWCGTIVACFTQDCDGVACYAGTLACPAGLDHFTARLPYAPVNGEVSGDCTGSVPAGVPISDSNPPPRLVCPTCCPAGTDFPGLP